VRAVASIDSAPSASGRTRGDGQVVQGHDARQVGHVGGEGADLVVAAGHADGDGQLGVEVLDHHLAGTEQLELQAPADASVVDVGQQRVHLGFAGQLLLAAGHVLLRPAASACAALQVDRLLQLARYSCLSPGSRSRSACSSSVSAVSTVNQPTATTATTATVQAASLRQPGPLARFVGIEAAELGDRIVQQAAGVESEGGGFRCHGPASRRLRRRTGRLCRGRCGSAAQPVA
jgi:hypothetical protein